MEGLKMQKESVAKISEQVDKIDKVKDDKFHKEWKADTGRVSYDAALADHCCEELSFIAGVLDMFVVLYCNDKVAELNMDSAAFVLMEARSKANELQELL